MPRFSADFPRAVAREAAFFAFFLVLAMVATRPLVADLRGKTLAGPDPLIDLWTVHWLSGHFHDPAALFGGNIFYPSRHAVLFSDLSMGTAVLLAPSRLFVSDPVPVYNLAVLLSLAFGGWAFSLLARENGAGLAGGLVAGTLASFGSHQLSHIYHLNLLTIGWIALFVLGLQRLLARPTAGAVVLAAVSAALTAMSSGYYAVTVAVVGLYWAIVEWRRVATRRVLLHAAAAAALALVLFAPYLFAFLDLREAEDLRRPPGMSANMALQLPRDLSSFSYVYRGLLGSAGERFFPGVLTLVLGSVALARRRPGAWPIAGAIALLLVLALGPRLELGSVNVPLPYAWLFSIPPLDGMRHPYTFAAGATFLASVLAGIGWGGLELSRRRAAGIAVVALAVAETLAPPPALREIPAGVPPVYRRLAELPPGPVLEIPVFATDNMLWSARHGLTMVNGDGAFAPQAAHVLQRNIQNHWIARDPEDLDESKPALFLRERLPVRYVIVPAGRDRDTEHLVLRFDESKLFRHVATVEDGDRIYEMTTWRSGGS